ncbi:MAG TPA: M48 family metalloprotease [Xanthomonadaceae bacterium]|nr:M48 family metalloprotease [Xanthomonadaceae bacterium]
MIASRFVLLAAALALATARPGLATQGEYGLPDIGSSAAGVISPAKERMYGEMTRRELRGLGLTVEDPLLQDYLTRLGYRLVEQSERPGQAFTFFWLRDDSVNAFATLGGYIAVNAGLFLAAEREDEVAAVMAHEIAHVTQRHIVRAVERAQKDSLPIALAMLGAMIAASQYSDSRSSGDASQAALASGIALMQQRQINYTRSNEQEADRIGIRALARADYDPMAMADFFGRLQRVSRAAGSGASQAPEYLRTHPVTTSRISEAKDRARTMEPAASLGGTATGTPLNPLLPDRYALRDAGGDAAGPLHSGVSVFELARERLRVATAESAVKARVHYRDNRREDPEAFGPADQYGMALAQARSGQATEAIERLETIQVAGPARLWVELALAEAERQAGYHARSDERHEVLLARQPGNRAIALAYAEALSMRGTAQTGRRALEVLRPLLAIGGEDAAFQQQYARAAELAGDEVRAAEAYAQVAYLSGRAEDALNQLERLKRRDDLSYYERARVEARIDEILPIVLELRERGIRPGMPERGLGLRVTSMH